VPHPAWSCCPPPPSSEAHIAWAVSARSRSTARASDWRRASAPASARKIRRKETSDRKRPAAAAARRVTARARGWTAKSRARGSRSGAVGGAESAAVRREARPPMGEAAPPEDEAPAPPRTVATADTGRSSAGTRCRAAAARWAKSRHTEAAQHASRTVRLDRISRRQSGGRSSQRTLVRRTNVNDGPAPPAIAWESRSSDSAPRPAPPSPSHSFTSFSSSDVADGEAQFSLSFTRKGSFSPLGVGGCLASGGPSSAARASAAAAESPLHPASTSVTRSRSAPAAPKTSRRPATVSLDGDAPETPRAFAPGAASPPGTLHAPAG